MDLASRNDSVGPQLQDGLGPSRSLSVVSRVVAVVGDCLLAVAALVAYVGMVIAPITGEALGARLILGIWAGFWAFAALPGVWLLASVPPRKRLRERSALVDRAAAFGKSVWSVVIFLGSLVIGTAVGIGASATADEQSPSAAIEMLLAGEAQRVGLQALGAVASVAMLHMVVMWIADLGAATGTGEVAASLGKAEQRWTGRTGATERAVVRRAVTVDVVNLGAKMGLLVSALTLLVTYWIALT